MRVVAVWPRIYFHSFSCLFIHESHPVSTFEILQLTGWLWDHPCPSMVWSHVAFVSCRQWVLKNASIGVSLRLGANSKTHSCCEMEWIYPVTIKLYLSGHRLLFYSQRSMDEDQQESTWDCLWDAVSNSHERSKLVLLLHIGWLWYG